MKRRFTKKQRVLIAYTLRTLVGLTAVLMIVLMVCGCIFLWNLLFGGKHAQVSGMLLKAEPVGNDIAGNPDSEEDFGDWADISGLHGDGLTIVLDAGHGGNDCGTSGGSILEKDITLSVVQYMKALMEQLGAEVLLTRDSDTYVSLEERTEMANRSAGELFVSIHCNYYEDDASVKGLECYYFEDSESGKTMAEDIIEDLRERDNIEVRSAKPDTFYVLKNTKVPAVLIELGFLSNFGEEQKLADAAY